ncbi:hypothetical protein Q3G72_015143 [Acer saccharum]|nr:hypothetical protein Q3G72_015143 [Acer saccharum]
MSEVQTTTDKEDSPFGPWLLVSYGKQVSRNYKGKSWKAGNGNANFVARNGIAKNGPENNIRSGLDSNSRKMDGEFTEMDMTMNKGNQNGKATGNKLKGKFVLSEITNLSSSQDHRSGKRSKKILKKADKMGFKKIISQVNTSYSKVTTGTNNSKEQQMSALVIENEGQDM